jgi:hypothetical protein
MPYERSKGCNVALFYHIGIMKHWRSTVYDQLHTLETCGLGYMVSSLTVSYSIHPEYCNVEQDDCVTQLAEFLSQFDFTQTLNITFIESLEAPWESETMASIAHTCR